MQANQQHLSKLVYHIDNTSIAEALAHVVGADELSATFMMAEDLQWLRDTPVLQVTKPLNRSVMERISVCQLGAAEPPV